MCCAQKMGTKETESYCMKDIPNPHLLHPHKSHPCHERHYNGMLLYWKVFKSETEIVMYHTCMASLKTNRLPQFALANGTFIGEVPPELRCLTLAERLLVCRYIPAVYLIKLHPRDPSTQHWDTSRLYSGIRGNICSYALDTG